MTRATIALGSNLGDRLGHLRSAMKAIGAVNTVISVSSLYETDPVGGPDQGPFLNAVTLIDTSSPPDRLLTELQQIESDHDRVRDVRWGPRTLDLDIVTFGSERVEEEGLFIPHPRAAERGFVLVPLAEIAPRVVVSDDGLTAEQAAKRIGRVGIFRFHGDWLEATPRLGWISGGLLAVQAGLIVTLVVVAVTTAQDSVPPWQTTLGLVLAALGAVATGAGGLALGSTLSALPDPRPDGSLIERGPFGIVRHPIYGGLLVGGVGLGLMVSSWWTAAPVLGLAVLFDRKSSMEERAITLLHPDYPDYRRRVTRRFIPLVW